MQLNAKFEVGNNYTQPSVGCYLVLARLPVALRCVSSESPSAHHPAPVCHLNISSGS